MLIFENISNEVYIVKDEYSPPGPSPSHYPEVTVVNRLKGVIPDLVQAFRNDVHTYPQGYCDAF